MQNGKSSERVGLIWNPGEPEDHRGLEECAALSPIQGCMTFIVLGTHQLLIYANSPNAKCLMCRICPHKSELLGEFNLKKILQPANFFTKLGKQLCKSECIVDCKEL